MDIANRLPADPRLPSGFDLLEIGIDLGEEPDVWTRRDRETMAPRARCARVEVEA